MTPQIEVAPSSIYGVNTAPTCSDANDPTTCTASTIAANPLQSFTAYATPAAVVDGTSTTGPVNCGTTTAASCSQSVSTMPRYICGYAWNGNLISDYTGSRNVSYEPNGTPHCCWAGDPLVPYGGGYQCAWCSAFTGCTYYTRDFELWPQGTRTVVPVLTSGQYWRVCLDVTTSAGKVSPTIPAWGEIMGTVVATTRCVPNNETPGSQFSVYRN